MEELKIPFGQGALSASLHGSGPTVVVLGHGAGGHRRIPFLLRMAEALAASGRRTLLYNFAYTEERRRSPDAPERLEAATQAVGAHAREALGAARLVHGGKSMGGRIASQVVAKGAPADGLVFFGYPLHAPGRPEVLRDRHLPAVAAPMLFLQGTRDAFARWDLIESVAARLGERATLHRLEGADHSFGVLKRSGRTSAQVEAEIVETLLTWLKTHGL
jgi:predicted alpha/beta-hydrolase family hydrolase